MSADAVGEQVRRVPEPVSLNTNYVSLKKGQAHRCWNRVNLVPAFVGEALKREIGRMERVVGG